VKPGRESRTYSGGSNLAGGQVAMLGSAALLLSAEIRQQCRKEREDGWEERAEQKSGSRDEH